MEVTTAKILILFGLLFTTLFAALLPLLCLKLSSRHRRKRRRMPAGDDEKSFFDKICCVKKSSYLSSSNHDKTALERNGSVQTTITLRQRVKSRSKLIMSMLNCFAGGIFLGTSFIGLLPEIRESFEVFNIQWPQLTERPANMTDEEKESDPMPIAEMIVVCGLFFILCVEQAAHSWHHWRSRQKSLQTEVEAVEMEHLPRADRHLNESPIRFRAHSNSNDSNMSDGKPGHDHSGIRSLMLVATLSLHSLLEGVAIGLQNYVESVMAIFVAVLFHKCLMAFSMGTNLTRTKQTIKKIVAAAVIFALATPSGIAIGLVIKSAGGDNSGTVFVNAVLQAVATGTFLYITFFEVLVKEFDAHGNRLAKVLSLFVGYGAVLGSIFAQHG